MDNIDLKGKFKTFITESKQKLLSPTGGQEDVLADLPPLSTLQKLDRSGWSDSDREVSQMKPDIEEEEKLLESLDSLFYQTDSDPVLHCLNQLGDKMGEVETIDLVRKRLLSQLTGVSRRVFSMILDSQAECSNQLENMVSVQADLLDSLATCQTGRGGLARAQHQFVNCSLGILARCRRRQQAKILLDHLSTIRTLSLTQDRLTELLAEEDFPEAIGVILECVKVASNYRHFTAIKQLSSKLSDTLVMAEEQLDSALGKLCNHFQPDIYTKLQEAYGLLGKTQIATDQLLMHFTSHIHSTSWTVVYGHVCLMSPGSAARQSTFPELCREVMSPSFLPCLTDLLRSLWVVMVSYHGLVEWHKTNDTDSLEEDMDLVLARQYTKTKLEAGVGRIWLDVQTKVKQYVLASDLSQFSIDSFLHFLDLLHRLITVGQEFSGSPSSSGLLHDSLQAQCLAYFRLYHTSRLEELRTHLDNEAWTLCPVKPSFSYKLLAEFSHLQVLKSPSKSTTGLWFRRFPGGVGTPFDELSQETGVEDEDILIENNNDFSDSDDDDLSEEQKAELAEENKDTCRTLTGISPKPSSITTYTPPPATGLTITNTAVMLLRLIGKYSHMMKVLSPIADTVWISVCQLYQFYLYTVNILFAGDIPDIFQTVYSDKLKSSLSSIYATVIEHEVVTQVEGVERRMVGCVQEVNLCPGVDMSDSDNLSGLFERMIGVESTVFLANQMNCLRPHFDSALGDSKLLVDDFYCGTVDVSLDLRGPVYLAAMTRSLDTDTVLAMMSRVSWDKREVVSQHSNYVDHLLRELAVFSSRLSKVSTLIPVDEGVRKLLWQHAVTVTNNTFVEGFSLVKKCTNEGRALMQLDYRQFVLKLEKLSDVKPIPDQEFVTRYIKAYYIPETELEDWVGEHTEYTASQLRALVAAVTNSNSKAKQKLNNLISDLSGRIRR